MWQIKATTRQELLRLRKYLSQVKEALKLLEQKRDTLLQEFLKLKKEFINKKKELFKKAKEIITLVEFTESFNSIASLIYLSNKIKVQFDLKENSYNVMGVRFNIFKISDLKISEVDSQQLPKSYLDAIQKFESFLKDLIEVSSLERSLIKLAEAIEKTRRRTNFLKDITIPNIEHQIKYLKQRLSDQERESFILNLKQKQAKNINKQ